MRKFYTFFKLSGTQIKENMVVQGKFYEIEVLLGKKKKKKIGCILQFLRQMRVLDS